MSSPKFQPCLLATKQLFGLLDRDGQGPLLIVEAETQEAALSRARWVFPLIRGHELWTGADLVAVGDCPPGVPAFLNGFFPQELARAISDSSGMN